MYSSGPRFSIGLWKGEQMCRFLEDISFSSTALKSMLLWLSSCLNGYDDVVTWGILIMRWHKFALLESVFLYSRTAAFWLWRFANTLCSSSVVNMNKSTAVSLLITAYMVYALLEMPWVCYKRAQWASKAIWNSFPLILSARHPVFDVQMIACALLLMLKASFFSVVVILSFLSFPI